MLKKHLLCFVLAALIMFGIELLLTYINHKAIDIGRETFKPALIAGTFAMLLSIYFERRKKNKEKKSSMDNRSNHEEV